jgi:hypothetical protein
MIQSDPKRYETLFEEFRRLHPEYAEEPTYFPAVPVLLEFQKWAEGALNAAIVGETRGQSRLRSGVDSPNARDPNARDGGLAAELIRGAFRAENPEFLDCVAGDEKEEADELLPVTKRLLSGGVDE